jgi:hypothetical protein
MKKTISVTGPNGTFSGTIEVRFNDKSENKLVNNPSTHETEQRRFRFHRVYGHLPDEKEPIVSELFTNETSVWSHIEFVEQKLRGKLKCLANDPKEKSIINQLKEQGFTE